MSSTALNAERLSCRSGSVLLAQACVYSLVKSLIASSLVVFVSATNHRPLTLYSLLAAGKL